MASLYLGKIGNQERMFEIHALTKDLPFREYKQSDISDTKLFDEILKGRFNLFEEERPIYCTAVNPNIEEKKESNPHDLREGTVHFVAINEDGEISCALSVAVDIGEKSKGTRIGLPLENRWNQSGFPEGQNLDKFREKYLRLNYNVNRSFRPWEMAELYRHFKNNNEKESLSSRLGIYTGCYHLLVREARKKNLTQTPYWVFDAIPPYFSLYKYAGAAVLRDFTIKNPTQYLSPNKSAIKRKSPGKKSKLVFNDKVISRMVQVPFPSFDNGLLSFKSKDIPFIDGIIDINKCEKMATASPLFLQLKGIEGFTFNDRIKLRHGFGVIGKRFWDQDCHSSNFLVNALNKYVLKKTRSASWDFNHIGSNL